MTPWHGVYPRVFALLSLLPLSLSAHAATFYANQNASDATQDGKSWATAFKTIQDAVAAAGPGDEVWVAKGTYRERVVLHDAMALYGGFAGTETDRSQRDIRANRTSVVWDDTGTAIACSKANATINGFTIRAQQYGITSNATDSATLIANNVITGCNIGVSVNGISAVLSRNVISGNITAIDSSVNALILTGNTISANQFGLHSYFVTGLERSATLIGNTVSGNNDGLQLQFTHVTMVNNIVAFNGLTGVLRRSGPWSYLSHNNVYGNGRDYDGITDPTGQNGNISVDPGISNIYRDIHIQPSSPCRGAGDNDAEVPLTDIDGQPRIQDGKIDIGSDESDGTAWTVPSQVWHVSTTGNDANDGTSWATAKKTISGALSVALAGDEVWVARGSYAERATLPPGVAIYGGFAGTEAVRSQRNVAANPVTIVPSDPQWTVLSLPASGGRLDGLTVRDAGSAIDVRGNAVIANCTVTASTNAVTVSGAAATLTGNVLSDNQQGFSAFNSNVVLTGNTVTDNLNHGIFVTQDSTATVTRNTISGNRDAGLRADLGATVHAYDNLITGTQGIAVRIEASAVNLYNNTIALSDFNGTGITVEGSQVYLTNNIVAYHARDGVRLIGANNVVTFLRNNVFANSPNYTNVSGVTILSNIHDNPLFVDHQNGDFGLQAGSPLVDAGNDDAVTTGDLDLAGKPRIIGAHVDIGAFEYAPPGFATLADVLKGLRISGGLDAATSGDVSRLNVVDPATLRISMPDAVRLARKVAGLDPNP